MALRGPDSSEDERRLGEQAVFPETVDVNIRQLGPIPAPRAFLKEHLLILPACVRWPTASDRRRGACRLPHG